MRSKKEPVDAKVKSKNPFEARSKGELAIRDPKRVHIYRKNVACLTEPRGYSRPNNSDELMLRVDSSHGFIPLWDKDVILNWRFDKDSIDRYFLDSSAAMDAIERMFAQALLEWGDAAPVRFAKNEDTWDFQIGINQYDDCDSNGCAYAEAFNPSPGRELLSLYPKMFKGDSESQITTLTHEAGHIFGLKHWFASADMTELFGTNSAFSIMNYGANGRLTDADKTDLIKLYQMAWSGELTQINGTPIRLIKPYHQTGQ